MHHVTALIATLAKGGLVMIPLLVCSVLSLADIERWGSSWRRRLVEAMNAARTVVISRMAIALQPMEKR